MTDKPFASVQKDGGSYVLYAGRHIVATGVATAAALELLSHTRDCVNKYHESLVAAARKEEREALESRLSLAEKVVEAAKALRNEPHIYDVDMDRYVKCIERNRCDLCKPFDAALSAYRSAK